ncbi:MAG: DUF481 domain-containing protein [Marinobacter sp.]|nr:DUF481 domain-containing protein [Marinobacter sp.]
MRFTRVATCVVLATVPMAYADTSGNWSGEAEIGVLMTSGNTEETKINSRLAAKHEVEHWRNQAEFRSLYSEAGDNTTAERYRAILETDYKFTERQFWFVRGSYDNDRFTGFDFQSSLTTGYGNRVWEHGDRSFVDLTLGLGYRYDRLKVANDDGRRTEEDVIARLAGQFDYELSETALFRQKLSTEVGLDDGNTVSESETALQATLVGNLSMKASYRVKHVSDVPDGFKKTDTEVALSLLYGF